MLAQRHTFSNNNSLLIHDFDVDILSFKFYRIAFIFSIPFKQTESTNLYIDSSPSLSGFSDCSDSPASFSLSDTNLDIYSNNNINNIHNNYQFPSQDEFRIVIHTEPRFDGCWIKLNSIRPIDINQSKWKAEYFIELSKPKDFIVLSINVEYLYQYYSCKYTLLTDIENAIWYTLRQHLKKNWNFDVPKELWNIIKDYSPGIFWLLGEPWLVVDKKFPLSIPNDFVSTEEMWTEGVYVEDTNPQKIIQCDVKFETSWDFAGVFIPTQVQPEPHSDFMVWTKEPEAEHLQEDIDTDTNYSLLNGSEWENNFIVYPHLYRFVDAHTAPISVCGSFSNNN